MTQKDLIQVRIIDFPGFNTGCICSCSRPLTVDSEYYSNLQKGSELREALEAAFPGKTSFEYVDLGFSPEERFSEAAQLLMSGAYPSPIILINDEARFSGSIQVNNIVFEVGKIIASKASSPQAS